jgi:hypothetical protein
MSSDSIVTVRSVETRRPDGTVLMQWCMPSNQAIYVENLFAFLDERILGAAQAWISESGGGGDWQLLAEQDEQGGVVVNHLPGVVVLWKRDWRDRL